MLTQSVDAFAGEHQQTVFHDVDLDHGQGRTGLERHRGHHEIEGGIRGDKRADVQRIVSHERLPSDGALLACDERGGGYVR